VNYELVNDNQQIPELLEHLSQSELLGFDTEFVSEDCYRPELCLLQVSTRDRVYLIDPQEVTDMAAVWQRLLDPQHLIVVHACREEVLFAYRATGQTFSRLFDIQVAVGILGGEYPSSYGKLLQRYLGQTASKGETRTDWRRRPLTRAQMDYAALDVLHLPQLYDTLQEHLSASQRSGWLENELQQRQSMLVDYERAEGWTRLPGVQSMSSQQLAVVRELWDWRNQRAIRKNMPARRVLRDDLIIELARRGTSDPKKISHLRGLHHAGFQRFIPEIAECIARGLKSAPPDLPWSNASKLPRPPALLQQFLTAAMGYLCRSNRISPAVVGTSDDVGQLAAYWLAKLDLPESDLMYPNLLRGWRGELIGQPLHEIYSGRRTLWVQNPKEEMPLAMCDVPNSNAD
jgi:ribonuclease D